jgi:hypothetical protein
LVTDRTTNPTLADTGWAGHDQIVMRVNPGTLDEFEKEGAIEAARSAVIDIFDACLIVQLGVTESRCEPTIATMSGLPIEQQAEPCEMREVHT